MQTRTGLSNISWSQLHNGNFRFVVLVNGFVSTTNGKFGIFLMELLSLIMLAAALLVFF